jgi:outer membrane protein assembly factor BamB
LVSRRGRRRRDGRAHDPRRVANRDPRNRSAAQRRHAGDAVLLDRRIIVNDGANIVAIDTDDGRTLWEADVRSIDGALWTDGRLPLIATVEAGTPQLTAVDVVDGRQRWTVPAPASVRTYVPTGGRPLAVQQSTMVALGSPRSVDRATDR